MDDNFNRLFIAIFVQALQDDIIIVQKLISNKIKNKILQSKLDSIQCTIKKMEELQYETKKNKLLLNKQQKLEMIFYEESKQYAEKIGNEESKKHKERIKKLVCKHIAYESATFPQNSFSQSEKSRCKIAEIILADIDLATL